MATVYKRNTTYFQMGEEREVLAPPVQIVIEGGGMAELPVATAETLGGVKVPADCGILIDEEGNLSLDRKYIKDGKVYVPHLDEHRVLTWTVEDEAGEVPEPVDLNPDDEWQPIDEDEMESDYVWEPL